MKPQYRTLSVKVLLRESSIIWSASFCAQTGIPALWSQRAQKWVCQVHKRSSCVATFENQDLLDREAKAPPIHPDWPSAKEIAAHKRMLKRVSTAVAGLGIKHRPREVK